MMMMMVMNDGDGGGREEEEKRRSGRMPFVVPGATGGCGRPERGGKEDKPKLPMVHFTYISHFRADAS